MNLADFDSFLFNSASAKQSEALLETYLSQFGFKAYAFTYYAGHVKSGQKLRYHFASATLTPWHHHYLNQDYADVDRTLEENHTATNLPLFWDVNLQLETSKQAREKRIRLESIEFGIDKGLSLPLHGPCGEFATLVLHQMQKETCLVHYQRHQFEWLSAAHIFYHHIRKQLNFHIKPIPQTQLTHREEQCLRLTAQSMRVEQIAKELNISPRTVNFHIQNANKKLGTNNKYQAIAKHFT